MILTEKSMIRFKLGNQTWEVPASMAACKIANKYARSLPHMDDLFDRYMSDKDLMEKELTKLHWSELERYATLVGQPTYEEFQNALSNKEFTIEG